MGPVLVFFVLCASLAVPHLAKGKAQIRTLLPQLALKLVLSVNRTRYEC